MLAGWNWGGGASAGRNGSWHNSVAGHAARKTPRAQTRVRVVPGRGRDTPDAAAMAAGAGSAAIAAPAACFPHGGFEESTTASRQLCSTRTAASQGSLMKGVPLGSLLHPFGMGLPKLPCCPGAEARPPPKSALEPGLRELNPAPLRCGVAPRTVRSKSLHDLKTWY